MSNTNTTKSAPVNPYTAFAWKHGIRTEVVPGPATREGWPEGSHHWRVTFKTPLGKLTTLFSQGAAHTDFPVEGEVLECLVLDTRDIEETTFEEWASNYGYDEDSRKAEKIYQTCKEVARKLDAMLSSDALAELYAIEV
jgi:hypothetical protein